ncbi:MAG TPA: hypothetical protein VML55_25480 [Planctomycetaceae bacterium]|nr:hypothetical protein [Planctomycetaceae bacterium]
MPHRLFLTTVAWLSLVAGTPAAAVDYHDVDRTLVKEPDYRTDMPQYALLVFGPRAELRVWAVFDGDALYLDRNADGDLTQPDERFATLDDCRGVTIGGGRPAKYVINRLSRLDVERDEKQERMLIVGIEVSGAATFRQLGGVWLQGSAAAAHLAHFDGPISIFPGSENGLPGPEHVLKIGEPVELDAVIGTIDAGAGCWTAVEVERGGEVAFPPGVFPWVDVEFPARGGGEPIRQSFPLSGFC